MDWLTPDTITKVISFVIAVTALVKAIRGDARKVTPDLETEDVPAETATTAAPPSSDPPPSSANGPESDVS